MKAAPNRVVHYYIPGSVEAKKPPVPLLIVQVHAAEAVGGYIFVVPTVAFKDAHGNIVDEKMLIGVQRPAEVVAMVPYAFSVPYSPTPKDGHWS